MAVHFYHNGRFAALVYLESGEKICSAALLNCCSLQSVLKYPVDCGGKKEKAINVAGNVSKTHLM